MNKNEYVSDFLKYNFQDEYFNDCFSEFIEYLTAVDLSKGTIYELYQLFIKDSRMYFEKKETINLYQKIKDKIKYLEYDSLEGNNIYDTRIKIDTLKEILGDGEE